MSSTESFGYGIDIQVNFNKDNEIDLVISPTGDIALVGADGESSRYDRLQNAIQQIQFHVMTPFNGLKDENDISVPVGSQLNELIGAKLTDLNVLLLKSMVLSAIAPLKFIARVERIEPLLDENKDRGLIKVAIQFKIKNDDQVYFTTVDLTEIEKVVS